MPTLREIYATNLLQLKGINHNSSASALLDQKLLDEISGWLTQNDFNTLEFVAAGSSSIVLKPNDTNDYVIRISTERRSVVPQVIQAIHTQKFNYGALCVEIVPQIATTRPVEELFNAFENEIGTCGYSMPEECSRHDIGVFSYQDPRTRTRKEAPMAMDGGMVSERGRPTCTEDYPPLSMQWQKQCELVEKHPKLKKLLGGLPKPLPETKVIPARPRPKYL